MNSNYSNGLQGQNIIKQQTKTRVNNKAVGKNSAQVNRGTKVSTQGLTALNYVTCNTGVVNQIYTNTSGTIPSASVTIPEGGSFTVTDTSGKSYLINQMVNPPGAPSGIYTPTDNYGNYFYFMNPTQGNSLENGYANPQTITWNSTSYSMGTSFISIAGIQQGVSYYIKG
jgi:hypothetical protein